MTTPAIGLFGLFVLAVLIIRFDKGLLLLILIVPFLDILPETGFPGLNGITILVFTAFCLALRQRDPSVMKSRTPSLSGPIIILFFLTLISVIYTDNFRQVPNYIPIDKIFTIKRWFTFMLLFFIFRHGVKSRKLLEDCLFMIALGVILEGLYVVKEDLLTSHGRTYGTLGNENDLGAFFAAYFPVGVFFLLESKEIYKRLVGGASAFLALMGVSLSLSRGAFLSVTASLLVFFFFRSKKLFFVVLILFSLVILNYRYVLPSRVVERIDFTFQRSDEEFHDTGEIVLEGSAASRLIFIKGGIRMIKDHPIFGVGFGAFELLSIQYMADLGLTRPLVAHNMYVQIFSEMGLLGILTFLSILFFSFRAGLYLRKRASDRFYRGIAVAFLACLAALAIANAFGNRFYNGVMTGYFWIFSALMLNAQSIIIDREEKSGDGEKGFEKLPVRVQRRLKRERRLKQKKQRPRA